MEQIRSEICVAVRVATWMQTQQLSCEAERALDALCSTARVQLPAWGERSRPDFGDSADGN